MVSNKEISIFISLNVVSIADRLLSVPKRSSGAGETAGDPAAGVAITGVTTAPGVTAASPGSPDETDVWAGVCPVVSAWFLSTQPEAEAATTSNIKI